MTRKFLFVATLSTLFFACTKIDDKEDNGSDVRGNTRNLPFKVSVANFIQRVEELAVLNAKSISPGAPATKDSTLADKVSDIYFFVFATNGDVVKYTHQRSGTGGFGDFSDSLPVGTYTVAVAASSDTLRISNNGQYSSFMSILNPNLTSIKAFPDIFYKKSSFVVDSTQSSVINLSLDRVVGRLEVNITDAPAISPDSLVDVHIKFENTSFNLLQGTSQASGFPYYFPINRKSQHIFDDFILNTNSKFTVTINYPDRNSNARLSKVIENITVSKNKNTILTGKLYLTPPAPGYSESGFGIEVNSDWGPDSLATF